MIGSIFFKATFWGMNEQKNGVKDNLWIGRDFCKLCYLQEINFQKIHIAHMA